MANSGTNCKSVSAPIDRIEVTPDNLTGRAGLALFSRYLWSIDLMPHVDRLFGKMRRSGKGLPITSLFKQVLCSLFDATSSHLVQYDRHKKDPGYAGAIETECEQMASSHQVKRFFALFSFPRIWNFRPLLQHLFLWRLDIEQPGLVVLGLDTMVMDNSEANDREGVEPTYKTGTKGFKPLQLTWGPYIIDAVFRGGKKNCNHGDTVINMIAHAVRRIRKSYRADVPIIVRADSAFFDQKLFGDLEKLGVWYVISGRRYKHVIEVAHGLDPEKYETYTNGRKQWKYAEIWPKHDSWDRSRRAIYTYCSAENGQQQFSFTDDHILYTNLEANACFDSEEEKEKLAPYLETRGLIQLYHGRGSDELVHRAFKEFRDETLPFKRFSANTAFYYMALLAFFLFESFKRDVTNEIVPVVSYATRVRRTILDVAGKLTRHAHKIQLKVTQTVWEELNFSLLWEKANSPPRFAWS